MTECYIVVKFHGNNDILGCQTLDQVFFTRDAAERRAAAMQRRHRWIWRVLPVQVPIDFAKAVIKAELAARGISTK